MTNVLGRPKETWSRRRFCESVRFLKSAIANNKNPVAIRLNCVTLLMTIYGLQVPQTRAIKEQVKDLVMAHSFQDQMTIKLDRKLAEEDAAREQAAQDEADATNLESTRAMFGAVLESDD